MKRFSLWAAMRHKSRWCSGQYNKLTLACITWWLRMTLAQQKWPLCCILHTTVHIRGKHLLLEWNTYNSSLLSLMIVSCSITFVVDYSSLVYCMHLAVSQLLVLLKVFVSRIKESMAKSIYFPIIAPSGHPLFVVRAFTACVCLCASLWVCFRTFMSKMHGHNISTKLVRVTQNQFHLTPMTFAR